MGTEQAQSISQLSASVSSEATDLDHLRLHLHSALAFIHRLLLRAHAGVSRSWGLPVRMPPAQNSPPSQRGLCDHNKPRAALGTRCETANGRGRRHVWLWQHVAAVAR
jgi:hypothetical protein